MANVTKEFLVLFHLWATYNDDSFEQNAKFVEQSKCILGWNTFVYIDDGVANIQNSSNNSLGPPTIRRQSSSPNTTPHPQYTPPLRSLAPNSQSVELFLEQVRAGKIRLSIPTECTFQLQDFLPEKDLVKGYISASSRREKSVNNENFLVSVCVCVCVCVCVIYLFILSN